MSQESKAPAILEAPELPQPNAPVPTASSFPPFDFSPFPNVSVCSEFLHFSRRAAASAIMKNENEAKLGELAALLQDCVSALSLLDRCVDSSDVPRFQVFLSRLVSSGNFLLNFKKAQEKENLDKKRKIREENKPEKEESKEEKRRKRSAAVEEASGRLMAAAHTTPRPAIFLGANMLRTSPTTALRNGRALLNGGKLSLLVRWLSEGGEAQSTAVLHALFLMACTLPREFHQAVDSPEGGELLAALVDLRTSSPFPAVAAGAALCHGRYGQILAEGKTKWNEFAD